MQQQMGVAIRQAHSFLPAWFLVMLVCCTAPAGTHQQSVTVLDAGGLHAQAADRHCHEPNTTLLPARSQVMILRCTAPAGIHQQSLSVFAVGGSQEAAADGTAGQDG